MKHSKKIIVLLIIALFIISTLFLYVLNAYNNEISKTEEKVMNKENKVCSFLKPWYERNRVITHALGGIDGKTYTNSIDALDYNYNRGKRVFEADFNYTSDGAIVLTHDYQETSNNLIDFPDDYIPSYDEFMSNQIYYKYKPGNAEDLLAYMHEHSDMYLVSDIKYDNPAMITTLLQGIVAMAQEKGIEEVLDRFIIQFYYEQNYYDIQKIYPFKNYIYSLYAEKNKDFEGVKNFCVANDIPVVLMRSSWVKDETTLQVFNENNIKVYVYTLNNLNRIFERKSQGVYGVVSDYANHLDLFLDEYYMSFKNAKV